MVVHTLEPSHTLKDLHKSAATYESAGVDLSKTIHHTDRGVQYASHDYIGQLRLYKITPSMTENGNPKDNADAERLNETMKCQLLKGLIFHNIAEVRQAVDKAVVFYNTRRPHDSLGNLTPIDARMRTERFKRKWNSWREKEIDALSESTDDCDKGILASEAGESRIFTNFAPFLEGVSSGLCTPSTLSRNVNRTDTQIAI